MNPGLGDILTEAQIITDLQATNRWEAIDELISHLVKAGRIASGHRDAVIAAVRKRESSMSTGIGFGIGLPHASTELIQEPVAALGRSKRKINFDSLDGKPVSLVVLFLIPQGQFQMHLHTVAGIAKLLQRADFRQAPDIGAMLRIIRDRPAP
jgi:mannitol/fructose-specific phosphotransferase system IIA component (Ntr-type)